MDRGRRAGRVRGPLIGRRAAARGRAALSTHRRARGRGHARAGRPVNEAPRIYRYVASSPRGFGDLLARELTSIGATDVRERALGVEFAGPLEVAYRACLESRVAARVFLVVAD